PDFLAHWVNGKGLTIVPVPDPGDVEQRVLRSLPQLVVIDADDGPQGLALWAGSRRTRIRPSCRSPSSPVATPPIGSRNGSRRGRTRSSARCSSRPSRRAGWTA